VCKHIYPVFNYLTNKFDLGNNFAKEHPTTLKAKTNYYYELLSYTGIQTNDQLPNTEDQLPNTKHQLPITNSQLRITNNQLPITNIQLIVAD
jgi:hypothetical protein